jgi:cell division protein ZapB
MIPHQPPQPPFALRVFALYIGAMGESNPKSAVELELKRLEKRLEDLIVTVSQIKEENRALRQRQDTLTSERASLLQKNEQVRARVEAMIGRLKSMEQA